MSVSRETLDALAKARDQLDAMEVPTEGRMYWAHGKLWKQQPDGTWVEHEEKSNGNEK